MTVTGCLQKGDEADEYSITDTTGKTYGLRSSNVKLADHLGLTGKMQSEEKNEKNESSKEAGDLSVTNLKMVSTSCQ